MIKSTAWQWNMVDDSPSNVWKNPDPAAYYLLHRWKTLGFSSFLDLGCGLGRHSVLMAQNGFCVSAFDISDVALDRTKKWADSLGLSLGLSKGDMVSLPYADGAFDCLMCKNVISHTDTEGVRKTVSEIFRVLKNGGECYVTVASKADGGFSAGGDTVDENTKYRLEEGPEYMIPHFYADLELAKEIFGIFEIVDISHVQTFYTSGGKECNAYHYQLLCKKKQP